MRGTEDRRSWFGLGPRPRLPYYFHSTRRLRSLDEFEEPEWKGRVRFGGGERVTPRRAIIETLQWLVMLFPLGLAGAMGWHWLQVGGGCMEIVAEFKIGWC
jgi:hypothetical protein